MSDAYRGSSRSALAPAKRTGPKPYTRPWPEADIGRHADLIIVVLSWVFVIARLIHAGVFVSSNDLGRRSVAWLVGALVLLVMWVYFALRILLLI